MWHVETDYFAMAVFIIMLIKEHSLKKEYPDYVWATTCKDWVKLPPESCHQIHAVSGEFRFDEPEKLRHLLGEIL